jgi:PAS domain S-box-containing protein
MTDKANSSNANILRQKAEELLHSKAKATVNIPSEIDALRLLQELDVHKIELEMQNEELLLAKRNAEVEAEKYSNLYNFSPSGYFTLSKKGEIIELNFKGANLLGKERLLLLNNRFSFFVSDETRPTFHLFIEEIFKSNTGQTCELILSIVPDNPTYVYLSGIACEDGEQCNITMQDISKLKKAEEEIKEKEKYSTLFESNKDSITIFRIDKNDKPGNFIEVNPASSTLFGYTKKELLAMSVKDIEKLSDNKRKFRLATLKSEGRIDFESVIKNKKGNQRNVEIETLLINYINEPAVMNITRDITERKQTEDIIRKTQENLATIIEAIPDLLFETDLEGRIYHYQAHRKDLLAIPISEFLGKRFDEVYPADVANIILKALQEANKTSWSSGQQYSLDMPKGKKWFELSASPIKGTRNKDKRFILLARDITERKLDEIVLQTQKAKLETILKGTKTATWEWNIKTGETVFDERWAEILGYTLDEIAPISIDSWTKFTHPDDLIKSNQLLEKVFNGELDYYECEARMKHKNGNWVWVLDSGKINQWDLYGKPLFMSGTHQDVNARKQAEKAKEDALNLFNKITINVPGVVYQYLLRPDGSSCFPYASEGIKEIYRVTPEEVREDDSKVFENIHPDDYAAVIASIQESAKHLTPWKQEYCVKFNDDTVRHLYGNAMPQKQLDGSVLWHGFITDITENKITENSLRESEEKYRSLVENSPDAIIIYIDDKIAFTNDEGLRMLGAKNREEIIGIPFLQFIHPVSRANVIQNMKEVTKNKNASATVEVRFIRLDGTPFDAEIKAIPTIYENKNAAQVIVHDITERKSAEEKIRHLSQAVEQSPVSIFITNISGEIEYANPKFVETTGYTLEEVIGQNPRFLKSGHTSQGEYIELWQTIVSGKEWHGEFYNKKKDGSFYWESASISPIKNAEGKTTHFIALEEDITNRKNVEKELIISKEHAEESDRLKLAFLANMSHEIRTPMNGILGFTELLKAPQLSGEEQQEFIKIIEESGKRMLNIINDIISISKLESGQIEVSLSETNINEQIEYIHTFFKPEAKQKGIQLLISKELAFKDNFIKTDREKVYAVLINLVKNALKFTNEGSIEFGCEKKGDSLEFFIKDTGMGISKSQKKIIFERFRQASETISRTHEGSGLGLAISKAYVEMLGGKIWVESEEGKGSIFYFTIPFLSESKLEENAIAKKMESVVEEENKIKDLKVLIVEDDAISKLLITIAIKPFSKEILQVSTGSDAIDACRNNPDIDLVLMDINMPEMDGYKATKLIRKFNKDLVIIAQTANGMQSDRDEAIAAGCTDYISKPINIKSLSELIRKYLEK